MLSFVSLHMCTILIAIFPCDHVVIRSGYPVVPLIVLLHLLLDCASSQDRP